MNDGFRRFLVLVAVFVIAFLAVYIARTDIFSSWKANKSSADEKITLRLNPVISANEVQVLAAINQESAALVQAVVPSVVSIDTAGLRQKRFRDYYGRTFVGPPRAVQGVGSGVIVSEEGHVLTNHHVIQGNPIINLTLHDGSVHSARVIGSDPTVDIAVIKINDSGPFQALKFGDSSDIEVGHAVFAIGNPFGIGTSVTDGKISAKQRPISDIDVDLLQTSAPINPGNSGGPLVNIHGEIIGINSRIYSSDQQNPGSVGIGFAIPSNDAQRAFHAIVNKTRTHRGFLGMALRDNEPVGVSIIGMVPGSPATEAKLQIGDIILSYEGNQVLNTGQLISLIQRSPINSEVNLKIWRKGDTQDLTARIGKADDYNTNAIEFKNGGR